MSKPVRLTLHVTVRYYLKVGHLISAIVYFMI